MRCRFDSVSPLFKQNSHTIPKIHNPLAMRPVRREKWARGIYGPEPPRHPRKRASQFVWPRDKPHSSIFGRWKDVLQGKGPDVWVTRRGSDGPHRPVWSGWRTQGLISHGAVEYDNLGYKYVEKEDGPDLMFGHRAKDKRFYDFRTRTFGRQNKPHAYTDIKYCKQHRVPIYHRGRHEADDWWEGQFAADGSNPFEYRRWTPYHDWDEIPYYHDHP